MNFDNLKNEWADDTIGQATLNAGNLSSNKTSSLVSKLRKNMRNELIALLISYLGIIILFLVFSKTPISILIVSIGCFLLIIQGIYYYSRFYIFYKKIGRYDLTLRKSLRKIVYELELNIEIYRTYSFCAMPLATLVGFCIVSNNGVYSFVKRLIDSGSILSPGNLLMTGTILLVSQVIAAVFLNLHIYQQYGKYLKELKHLMEDLEEGE